MARAERKSRSSVGGALEIFQSADFRPEPTEVLDDSERVYFDRIVSSRESTTWSPHDIAVATALAMTQRQFFDSMNFVKVNGRTTVNERGTPVASPETAAMNQLSSSVRAFTATLGLSASQRGIAGGRQAGRNQAERDAKAVISRISDDELLA